MKLTFLLLNTTITILVDDTMTSSKINRRSLRKKTENKIIERSERTEKANETSSMEIKPPIESPEKSIEKPLDSSISGSQPILMVEVINVTHEKFKQTEEIKVYKIILKGLKYNFENNTFSFLKLIDEQIK